MIKIISQTNFTRTKQSEASKTDGEATDRRMEGRPFCWLYYGALEANPSSSFSTDGWVKKNSLRSIEEALRSRTDRYT